MAVGVEQPLPLVSTTWTAPHGWGLLRPACAGAPEPQ